MAKIAKVFYAQRLPATVIARIKEIAAKLDCSESAVISYLVERYDLAAWPPTVRPPLIQARLPILKPSATSL